LKLKINEETSSLSDGTFYNEGCYAHVGPQQQERERKQAIKALERLVLLCQL
jgi:hypothetical protein